MIDPPDIESEGVLRRFERLLDSAGYDPAHARQLHAEGMHEDDLRIRLAIPGRFPGSLTATHGFPQRPYVPRSGRGQPRKKTSNQLEREVVAALAEPPSVDLDAAGGGGSSIQVLADPGELRHAYPRADTRVIAAVVADHRIRDERRRRIGGLAWIFPNFQNFNVKTSATRDGEAYGSSTWHRSYASLAAALAAAEQILRDQGRRYAAADRRRRGRLS